MIGTSDRVFPDGGGRGEGGSRNVFFQFFDLQMRCKSEHHKSEYFLQPWWDIQICGKMKFMER